MGIDLTNINGIKKYIGSYVEDQYNKIYNRLNRIGLNFVTNARTQAYSQKQFKDQTGMLRASIGYIVTFNGVVKNYDFSINNVNHSSGDDLRSEGMQEAEKYSKSLVGNEQGFSLICVAGANYAFYVEAKGFDVITGSSLQAEQDLRKWF